MTFQQQAKEAIRASGGRITSQRELILDLLADVSINIDAEHLHQLASSYDPHISLPTVYRTLHTLESAHVISSRYVSSDHERKVYHVSDVEDTYHFMCRGCGRVIAFQSQLVEQLKQEVNDQLNAEVLTLCVCANGLCSDCRKENEE